MKFKEFVTTPWVYWTFIGLIIAAFVVAVYLGVTNDTTPETITEPVDTVAPIDTVLVDSLVVDSMGIDA